MDQWDEQENAWRARAVCKGVDPAVFYPADRRLDPAREYCAVCPVQAECLEYAIVHNEKHGVWGGASERQRRRLRRARGLRGD